MSTKIYDAFRFKKRGLPWETLWAIQDQARKNVQDNIIRYYRLMMDKVIYVDPEFNRDPDKWWERLSYVRDKTAKGVKDQAGSMQRNAFDVECSITVSPYKGRIHLRAFCDRASSLVGGALDFLRSHPDLEDYHYQNQADQPEDVSVRAWKKRAKDWEAIFSGPGSSPRQLVLNIADAQSFWLIDPWLEMGDRLRENPPTFPSIEELAVMHLKEEGFLSPLVEATYEEEFIKGARFTIGLDQNGEWEATLDGRETKYDKNLRNLVGWIKTAHMSPEQKKYLDDFVVRHSK